MHKIAGAKAETGASLEEVKAVAEKVIANVRSMGIALTPCIVPAAGKPNFTLAENEMEVGMGIHGEPGTHRDELKSADEIVAHLMGRIFEDINLDGSEVAVMINGLGATPLMELLIVNRKVHKILEEKGVNIVKKIALGVKKLALEMAPEINIGAAGGTSEGTLGSDYNKIYSTLSEIYTEDGVLVLFDLGSSYMTAQIVKEYMKLEGKSNIHIVDAALVEGAVTAAVQISLGLSIEEVINALNNLKLGNL